jgi:hypothetical protein
MAFIPGERLLLGLLSTALCAGAMAEPIPVKKMEGVVHGFLVLRSLDGKLLAEGDLVQVPRRGRIDSRLTFRFRDGSIHDELVTFTQDRVFLLESYHLVQKGPSFPKPLEAALERAKNRYEVRHTEEGGDEKVLKGRLELPADAYNGMFFTLLKNIEADTAKTTVSLVAFTPDPRVVSLEVSPSGEEPFSIGDRSRTSVHYLLDVEVAGFTGLLAKLFGKDPPPIHTWMLDGAAPTFVKFQGFLYQGGPVWSIELASPVWPGQATEPARSPTANRTALELHLDERQRR